MTAASLPYPEEMGPSNNPLVRQTIVAHDDLGMTITATLRLTGLSSDVRALFDATPSERHVDLVERALHVGLTTVATATEITATDTAREKLVAAAEHIANVSERIQTQNATRVEAMEKALASLMAEVRRAITDGRDAERLVREALTKNAGELGEAAKAMHTSRGELEQKTLAALTELTAAQAAAKESLLEGTETALRKLVDIEDPTSAPRLIKDIIDRAAGDMRHTTNKNVGEMEQKVRELLGTNSPFAETIKKLARESAERDLKHVEDLVDRLRTDVLTSRTREQHDPTVKGISYEDNVLELLEPAAGVYGLTPAPTGTQTGESVGSRKGDHVLLDEQLVAVIAIEARARKNVAARQVFEEMGATATNRGVKIVAYFVKNADCLPTGMGEFSRGSMPVTYKRLPDDVHAFVAVIDPHDPAVAERLALVLWMLDRFRHAAAERGDQHDAAQRIEDVLPCLSQMSTTLGAFRGIKGGLTRSQNEIGKVRASVDELERTLIEGIARIDEILNGKDGC